MNDPRPRIQDPTYYPNCPRRPKTEPQVIIHDQVATAAVPWYKLYSKLARNANLFTWQVIHKLRFEVLHMRMFASRIMVKVMRAGLFKCVAQPWFVCA